MATLVSIVIPVKNDTAALIRLLEQLPAGLTDVQIIISASGVRDAAFSALKQQRPDVIWIEGTAGRAVQLNTGAAQAVGDWLWFVHADSRLPSEWISAFRSLPAFIVGGSFTFSLDSAAWQARAIELGVRMRVRVFGMPYGDQGIFVRRAVFSSSGGFRPLPLMEDVEFVRRLRRAGRLRHLTLKLVTSARRWERDGWWRRSAGNLSLLLLYLIGVSPERLARRYHSEKSNAHQESR